MTGDGGSRATQADLASMLAEMDSRLEALQHELESVALPLMPGGHQVDPGAPSAGGEGSPAPSSRRSTRRTVGVAKPRADVPDAAKQPAAKGVRPSGAGDDLIYQTIVAAEQEARGIVDDARRRIGEISAAARSTIESALAGAPPQAAPGRGARGRRLRAKPPAGPESRSYDGELTIEAGPFGDLAQLNEFQDALESVAGIEDVHIHTFDSDHALFGARAARPTKVIAELQARVPAPVHVIEAGDEEIRLELVRDRTAGTVVR